MDSRINSVASSGLEGRKRLGIHVNSRIKTRQNWPLDALLAQAPGADDPAASFAVAHALSAHPAPKGIGDNFARELGGWSLRAALDEVKARGLISAYRWCFNMDEVLSVLSNHGPIVCTSYWTQSMMEPVNGEGLLEVSAAPNAQMGALYSYVIRGFDSNEGLAPEVLRIRTSLGLDWGKRGDSYIYIHDFERYLAETAECAALFGRTSETVHALPPVAGGGSGGRRPSSPDSIIDEAPAESVAADAVDRERLTIDR